MTINKTNIKNTILKCVLWLSFFIVSGALLDYAVYRMAVYALDYVEIYPIAEITVPRIVKPKAAKDIPIKDWVLNEFERNGINPAVADCVIWQESRWNDQAISQSREDFGLMQWHIQHVKSGHITPACAFDYRCSVKKAIEKIKKDNGWSAWYGYRDAGCGRFGKSFL